GPAARQLIAVRAAARFIAVVTAGSRAGRLAEGVSGSSSGVRPVDAGSAGVARPGQADLYQQAAAWPGGGLCVSAMGPGHRSDDRQAQPDAPVVGCAPAVLPPERLEALIDVVRWYLRSGVGDRQPHPSGQRTVAGLDVYPAAA